MLSTQEMAGVLIDLLGKPATSLICNRDEIVQAVDFMIRGF